MDTRMDKGMVNKQVGVGEWNRVDAITATGAMKVVGQGRGVVVDARPQVRRHQGSLPGAMVVDPGDVGRVFGSRSTGWVKHDAEIAVVSVPSEAPRIAAEIADLGYRNVHYVDGGFTAMNRVAQRDSR